MFRPSIDGRLEEQTEDLMEAAGFDDKGEFIRYCVRRQLEELRKQRIAMGDD